MVGDAIHVAAWHDDLIQLATSGFFSGVLPVPEDRWEAQRRSELRDSLLSLLDEPNEQRDPLELLYRQQADGEFVRLRLAELAERDDEEPDLALVDGSVSVRVTASGWREINSSPLWAEILWSNGHSHSQAGCTVLI